MPTGRPKHLIHNQDGTISERNSCGNDPVLHRPGTEINPPTAAHVEAVYRLLASAYRLPLLWLDWSGARVASVDMLRVDDYDEREGRVRLRASTTKTRQALWVELPDTLADALEASLGPREDRVAEAHHNG